MTLVRISLILLALAALLLPIPSRLVETSYSRGVYPGIQASVTTASNVVPVSLLDLAVPVLLVAAAWRFARRVRRVGVVSALVRLTTLAATLYLAFLLLWGMNYRRLPLDQKLDFDQRRIRSDAAMRLGENAVRFLNVTHAAAHDPGQGSPTLEAALAAAERMLDSPRLAVPAVPKRSLLELYFRKAGIDGMTDPFFLEIIINRDTLPFERPFVIAHERAHLAGYAHEAEANFVAWLACLQGSPLAQYSGWLAIYEHVTASLPEADGSRLAAQLAAGPRRDLQQIEERYARASPMVRDASRDVYDAYLRANRVREGIASYTAVVRLILGAGMEDGRSLRLR
jgi:hypothetical protein